MESQGFALACVQPQDVIVWGRHWHLSWDPRCGDENLPLGYPWEAHSFRPSKGNKATLEECLFNEVIFVNHSTSQTWSLLENEQFCIKRSTGVNGEGLTFSSSVSLVKWNCWGCAYKMRSSPQEISTLMCIKCKNKRKSTFNLQSIILTKLDKYLNIPYYTFFKTNYGK